MPFGLTRKAKAEARGEAKRKSVKRKVSCIDDLGHEPIIRALAADKASTPEVFARR
jgi:hypothetical protein